MIRPVVIVLVLTGFLSACQRDAPSERSRENASSAQVPSDRDFELYLKRKHFDGETGKVREQTRIGYLQRYALAGTLVTQNAVDADEIAEETRDFGVDLVIRKYFDEYLAKKVTEESAREYFAANRDLYAKFKVHLARILIRRNASQPPGSVDADLQRALAVSKSLQTGTSFASAVQKYSDDEITRKNHGDLGWVKSEDLAPGVVAQITSMHSGDISQPIGTREGYQIVQLLSDPERIDPGFEEVKSQVLAELRYRERQKEMERLLAVRTSVADSH